MNKFNYEESIQLCQAITQARNYFCPLPPRKAVIPKAMPKSQDK